MLVTLTQLRDRLRKDEEEQKEREANEEEKLKQKKKEKVKKRERWFLNYSSTHNTKGSLFFFNLDFWANS